MTDQALLATYLNDHFAAATAGVELARRAAKPHDGERGEELSRLADEIEADREAFRGLMKRLDVEESGLKAAAGWLAEKAGRLKPNDHLLTLSPLSSVLELEGLRAATAARICALQVLRAVAVNDPRITKEELEALIDRADDQAERLYKLHIQVAQESLAG